MNMDYTSVGPVSAGRLCGFVPQNVGLASIECVVAVLTETLIFVGTVVHATSRSAAHRHLAPPVIGNTFSSGSLSVDPRPIRCRGFTLVELMVVLTVAVILLAIAIPRFNDLAASQRLDTTANFFLPILGIARSGAIKRNAEVIVGRDCLVGSIDDGRRSGRLRILGRELVNRYRSSM